ncbi:MAG: outer membrane beta-barrel protein, partial [Terriglobales bacterium]
RILFLLVFCGLIASLASAQSSFSHYNFTAGALIGIGRGDVAQFVGTSFDGVVGAGWNFNRIFGVDGEYMYYDLGFKPSVIENQSLPGQSGHMQSFSIDGIVTVPRHVGNFGAYGIFGVGFYDRTVSARYQLLSPGALCQPAWAWWDLTCFNGAITFPQPLASNTKIAGGYNYGGGLTYRTNHFRNAKLFVEFRYHKAYDSDVETSFFPITVGMRW